MATLVATPAVEAQHQLLCVLPSLPKSAGVARHWALRLMADWGLAGDVQATAALGVSELVANGALHGSCDVIACRMATAGGRVRIEVREWLLTTNSATSPVLKQPDSQAERGRGLLLVDALSLDWGWSPPEPGSGNGSCVWALFGEQR